jgi:uncharacterized membrane protein
MNPKSRVALIARQFRLRPRLSLAVLVGLTILVAFPDSLRGPTRALVAWDVGIGIYLVLAWTMMARSSLERIRQRARDQDEGAPVILMMTVAAALASLAAIMLELIGVKAYPGTEQILHIALATLTILFSWALVHTAFALHYAHEFYADDRLPAQAPLLFPGGGEPDYFDFMYLAFVIGTTSQTADVDIASSPMRRLAMAHGIVSFFFNATLLAITVNIAAGLI